MIGTWQDTALNLVIFVYVGWLIYLWLRPARGPLMPKTSQRGARTTAQPAAKNETGAATDGR